MFADTHTGMIVRPSPMNFSMNKARKRGFHGFVDSNESIFETFKELARIKMIPPVPETHVSFN